MESQVLSDKQKISALSLITFDKPAQAAICASMLACLHMGFLNEPSGWSTVKFIPHSWHGSARYQLAKF